MGALDTRKHDVDILERVLGGVRDRAADSPTHVVDVPADRDGDPSTVEVTVGLGEDGPPPRAGRRRTGRS